VTIFLQLSEEQYKQLTETLAFAYNCVEHSFIPYETGTIREELQKENKDLEELMTVIGEQGQSQINKI
jgi:hypothetical protein